MTKEKYYKAQSLVSDITSLEMFISDKKDEVFKLSKRRVGCSVEPDIINVIRYKAEKKQLNLAKSKLEEITKEFKEL